MVAVAINDILFASQGRLVAILSEHALVHRRWVGHIVVQHHEAYWDLEGAHPDIEMLTAAYVHLPSPRGIIQRSVSTLFGYRIMVGGHRRDSIPGATKRQARKAVLFEVTSKQVHEHMPGTQGVQNVRDVFARARARIEEHRRSSGSTRRKGGSQNAKRGPQRPVLT